MNYDALDMLNTLTTDSLKDIDTSFPVLAAGTSEFQIVDAELKDSNSGGKYLLFACKLLTGGRKDTNGNDLSPGYPIRHMINLTPSAKQLEKKTEEECVQAIMKDIAKFCEAVSGPQRTWPGPGDLHAFRGNTFWAKHAVQPERTDPATGTTYDAAAIVASLVPKEEDVDIFAVSSAFAAKDGF